MTGVIWLDVLITIASIFAGMFIVVVVARTYESVGRKRYKKAYDEQKRALKNAFEELEEENKI